jgi:hypothetical protein
MVASGSGPGNLEGEPVRRNSARRAAGRFATGAARVANTPRTRLDATQRDSVGSARSGRRDFVRQEVSEMRKPNGAMSSADQALAALAPMLDRVIQAESGKVLAELESLIAERVRTQMWTALQERLGGVLPERVAPPAPKRRAAPAPRSAPATGGAPCNVDGCTRPARSMGYCSAHYQSARKYGWPRPCPEGFAPPPVRRGRPPAAAKVEAEPEDPETTPSEA